MHTSRSIASPINSSSDKEVTVIHLHNKQKPRDRSIVESMLYFIVNTIPDTAMTASSLGPHVENLTIKHFIAAKRMLRYLNGARDLAFSIEPGESKQLTVFADSKYGAEQGSKKRSRSDILINYGSGPVYVGSLLQKGVTLISTEAEYAPLLDASRITYWLPQVLNELRIPPKSASCLSG